MSGLRDHVASDFKLEVTRLFFSLPASKEFLLAGGAALLAQLLTTRPTEDLDFFTVPGRGHVPAARDALEAAARKQGWATERIHDSDTFCRLIIRSGTAEVVTDLAVDTPPDFPASITAAGPTLAPEEAAGKLADYAIALGRQAVPEVVPHLSVAERFTRCAPDLSGVVRRTLCTNLRFISRRLAPHLYPADLPLPRERAKAPYAPAEVVGYLAMADAQPTAERRMRAARQWRY